MAREWIRGNVLGLVAIFIALSGTAVAVQGSDSKPAAPHDAKADAASAGVAKAELATAQVYAKKGKGRRGPRGPAGPQGPQGIQGIPGPVPPNEGWHEVEPASTPGGEPDFESGWTNLGGLPNQNQGVFSTAAFRRDRDGLVHLKGVVTGGSVGGTQLIFRLPAGYMPEQAGIFGVATADPDLVGHIYVAATGSTFAGAVIPFSGSTTWTSLDGITFRCGPSGANGCP